MTGIIVWTIKDILVVLVLGTFFLLLGGLALLTWLDKVREKIVARRICHVGLPGAHLTFCGIPQTKRTYDICSITEDLSGWCPRCIAEVKKSNVATDEKIIETAEDKLESLRLDAQRELHRLDELAAIPKGEPLAGVAGHVVRMENVVNADTIEVLRRLFSSTLFGGDGARPVFYTYPTPDGDIQIEWEEGPFTASARIHATRVR